MMNKDDFDQWKTDPLTKQVLNYLEDVIDSLDENYLEAFKTGSYTDEETFYRDSERRITIYEFINLEYEDMEAFYETSVGTSSSTPIED